MTLMLEITEHTFIEQFPLLPNHLNPNASFDWGAGYETLFETYGQDWEFIRAQPVSTIWTLVDTDYGLIIVSGFAFVNRFGYFVSRVAVPESVSLEVSLEDASPPET